jgi:hypothetical protein
MSKNYNLKWSKGNSKLNKDNGGVYNIVGFGIPANMNFVDKDGVKRNTCPSALACVDICYAQQGAYLWRTVHEAREFNLKESQEDTFVVKAIADLKRMKKANTIRIHDSGDFYSVNYYDKWCQIAKAFPEKIFYAYTKSLDFDLFSAKPDNLKITQSLGGKQDHLINLNLPHSRIFSSDEARVKAGYIDGNVNDTPAIEGEINIGLVYHGNKNLTEGQKKYFG